VTCSAQDAAGNSGSASFVVTVADTVAPLVTVPSNIVTTTVNGALTASVSYSASATDLGQPLQVVCSSTAGVASVYPVTQPFPAGTTVVTCVASDGRGNAATASFTVTVQIGLGIIGPLSPYQTPPKTYNSGSSIPRDRGRQPGLPAGAALREDHRLGTQLRDRRNRSRQPRAQPESLHQQ
jgi:hypothetical protein